MSTRATVVLVVALALVGVGAWRVLIPAADTASRGATEGASSLVATTQGAALLGAQASLDAQRNATGSYAGAVVQAPVTLVRADEASYCIQLEQGTTLQHLSGPGGTAQAGPC